MADPVLDKERFLRRLGKLYKAWKNDSEGHFNDANALCIALGASGDAVLYTKTQSAHLWLFGLELPDAIVLLTPDKVTILASKKKIEFMSQVASSEAVGDVPPIELLTRNKADKDAENFKKLIQVAKAAGNKVGEITEKDKLHSEFTTGFRKALETDGFELVDFTLGLSIELAKKEDIEVDAERTAANIACAVWNKFLRRKLLECVENETKIRHETLATDTEKAFDDRKVVGAVCSNLSHIESAYSPIIQSGAGISFKLSSQTDKTHLTYGAMHASLGARYQDYCANVSRVFMLEPTKDLEKAYQALIDAQEAVVEKLKPGNTFAEAYEAGIAKMQSLAPELVELMPKSFGFVTGFMFRDVALAINAKNTQKIQSNMVIIVHMGLQGVPNPRASSKNDRTVGLVVSDTYLVNEDAPAECLTEAAKRRLKNVSIKFEDTGDAGEDNKENIEEELGRGKRSVLLKEQTRNKQTNEDKRKEHQKKLAEELNVRARARLSNAPQQRQETTVKKSNVSYKQPSQLPAEDEVRALQIYVDRENESILLPIYGVPVPFHVAMIKNISTSVEGDGDFTYLRINFEHPGATEGSKAAQKFVDPKATFIKELTYRSSNMKEPGELHAPSSNLHTAFRLIKEMQKRYRAREAEEREREGAVKQDKLVLSTNKANPKLKELFLRPNIVSKRVTGTLECHLNGFRYTSLRGDKVDVLFNNIKHAFFQPCDNEMIVLLHFKLKQPVLFGKKKQSDIQFYTEVGEVTTDLGKFHHMQDRDDVYLEQAEREMRHKLNLAFKAFCEKVERQSNNVIEFDAPFRELGFFGVPHRSTVLLQPTSGCLVSLVEWPPFVVTLEEVELVHFERVAFQQKTFDTVWIYKDYTQKPDMIQQIPMQSIDSIKEWLDSCDIHYTEGKQSLNWPKIMKTINDDIDAFFEEGGWKFLEPESDDEEDAENEEDSSEAYEPSDEDEEESEEDESDEDEESGEPTESESGSEEEDSEESGKDWSDLEEEAKRADRAKEREEVERERSSKKRKASPVKSGSNKKKRR